MKEKRSMNIKLFFAITAIILSSHLYVFGMDTTPEEDVTRLREIMNTATEEDAERLRIIIDTGLIVLDPHLNRGTVRSRAAWESESHAHPSMQRQSIGFKNKSERIILNRYPDLIPTGKTHRIKNLEKLKIIAAVRLGKATTDKTRRAATSKIEHYTRLQEDIAKSL